MPGGVATRFYPTPGWLGGGIDHASEPPYQMVFVGSCGTSTGSASVHPEPSLAPVQGPGWLPPKSFPVRQCLLTILSEEWHHRRYAERDLSILMADSP